MPSQQDCPLPRSATRRARGVTSTEKTAWWTQQYSLTWLAEQYGVTWLGAADLNGGTFSNFQTQFKSLGLNMSKLSACALIKTALLTKGEMVQMENGVETRSFLESKIPRSKIPRFQD